MQPFRSFDEMKSRAVAINLSIAELARRAGLAKQTAYRAVDGGGKNSRIVTEQKLQEALLAEELRLRDHLVGLHGVPIDAPAIADQAEARP